MNKLGEGISSQVSLVPEEYDLERFSSLVAEIDAKVLSGELSPEFVLDGLQSLLDGRLLTRDFPVWRTLHFDYRDAGYYTRQLQEINCNKTPGYLAKIQNAERLLHGKVLDEIDLVRASPKDLGFLHVPHVKRKAFYRQAQAFGLVLGWLEIALQLRIEYEEQPNGEWLTVSCGQNNDPENLYKHVRIGRGVDQLTIEYTHIDPDRFIPADQEFIFIKPRKEHAP